MNSPTLTSMLKRLAGLLLFLGAMNHMAFADTEADWIYRGEITGKGTRSEGFSGHLSYRGTPLPGKVTPIVTPIGTYAFKFPAPVPWAVKGWVRIANANASASSALPFSEEPRWYQGGKRSGTPGHWVYLPALQYWVDPAHLTQFSHTVLKDVDDSGTADPWSSVLADPGTSPAPRPKTNMSIFIYMQKTAAAGSKSAGTRGVLLLKDMPIPGSPGRRLLTRIGSFTYIEPGQKPWEASGWFPSETIPVEDTALAFSPDDLKKNSYKGPRRAGSPTDWCYDPDTNMWYSPEHLLKGH